MEYSDALDELMEDICDKCRYPMALEEDGQEQLDGICAGYIIYARTRFFVGSLGANFTHTERRRTKWRDAG